MAFAGSQPTYEGLKHVSHVPEYSTTSSSQPTYEGLKRVGVGVI